MLLCHSVIPKLFGLCRALGRFCAPDSFLLSKLHPPKRSSAVINNSKINSNAPKHFHYCAAPPPKVYSNFRSIIPRSLSMTFHNGSEAAILSGSQESIVDLR